MQTDTQRLEQCQNCGFQPAAFGFGFHFGIMASPRLALLLEVWGTAQQIDATNASSLTQGTAMVAAQYWVAPRVWLKGGVGTSNLSIEYYDGYPGYDLGQGTAVMGAVGYELLSAPRFSIDAQARIGAGAYQGLGERVYSSLLGVGLTWY